MGSRAVYFYGTLPDRPVVENVLNEGFKEALLLAHISEKERKERNIVFHSWRHYYAKVIADRVEQRQAQLALGHMTAAMTTYDADHKTESDLAAIEHAAADAFGSCLSRAVDSKECKATHERRIVRLLQQKIGAYRIRARKFWT